MEVKRKIYKVEEVYTETDTNNIVAGSTFYYTTNTLALEKQAELDYKYENCSMHDAVHKAMLLDRFCSIEQIEIEK